MSRRRLSLDLSDDELAVAAGVLRRASIINTRADAALLLTLADAFERAEVSPVEVPDEIPVELVFTALGDTEQGSS